jgi:seryl-tRNA synthetase
VLDLKAFEKEPEVLEKKLRLRGKVQSLSDILHLMKERKNLILSAQVDQEKRNTASKTLAKATPEEIEEMRSSLKILSSNIREKETQLRNIEAKLETLALMIPNILRDDVPLGADEDANWEVSKVGTPKNFDFVVRDHVDIGQTLGIIDIARASKISGARFAFLRGTGSRLNRALIQYFIDFHTSRGDIELTPPYLVREQAMIGTGQLPNLKEDTFQVSGVSEELLYLIPTAEVPVTNYLAGEILDEQELPLRFCSYSACFRAEAGAAGKDTRGLIRQHQFEKVEMVRIAMPEQADAELDAMVKRAGDMLSELELPYRIVLKCSGDTGFCAEKTYDLEVWLPAQNTYREVSSCSVFGTFQSRRAQIRYRPKPKQAGDKPKTEFPVTLNGSGLPLGRVLVAILENHQQADGSVAIPRVLWPYMRNMKTIE